MAALRCFSNYGKSLAGQSKASHFGETYRDMRHIIIKKVPHRVKQLTSLRVGDTICQARRVVALRMLACVSISYVTD